MGWASMAQRMLGVAVKTFSEGTGAVYWLTDGREPGTALPKAVFDTAHISVDPETGAPVSSANPVLGVCLADLPSEPTTAVRVRARGQLYRIHDIQPDGIAGLTIILKKA